MSWAETHDVLWLHLPDGSIKRFGTAKMFNVPVLVYRFDEASGVLSDALVSGSIGVVNGNYTYRGENDGKPFFNLEANSTTPVRGSVVWDATLMQWKVRRANGPGTVMSTSSDNTLYPWQATFTGGVVITEFNAAVDIGNYDGFLVRSSSTKQTLTQAADKVTVDIQNVDTAIGITLNEVATTLIGSKAVFAKVFKQSSGDWTSSPLCYGEIDDVRIDQSNATVTVISDTAPNVSFLTNRPLQKTCPLAFKGVACGYVGAETTCNKKRDDAGGCSGRNNVHRFGGFIADGELARPIIGTGFGDEFDPDRQRDRNNPRIPFGGRYQLPLDSPYTGF